MARPLRIEYSGAVYHITCRGNDRRAIFNHARERFHFVDLLVAGLEDYAVQLYAYALMTNHYHLVIRTNRPNLSAFMHFLNTSYTVWKNRRTGRSGHLFEGRFKSIVIDADEYLVSVTRYVNLNPVRTKMWKNRPMKDRWEKLQSYTWSSFLDYTKYSKSKRIPSVSVDAVWNYLGATSKRDGRKLYREHIRYTLANESECPWENVKRQSYLGNEAFGEFLEDLVGTEQGLSKEIVGAGKWREDPDVEAIVKMAAKQLGIASDSIGIRTRGSDDRLILMYLARDVSRCGLRAVGDVFGVDGSAVSHACTRMRKRLETDKRLHKRVQKARDFLIHYFKT